MVGTLESFFNESRYIYSLGYQNFSSMVVILAQIQYVYQYYFFKLTVTLFSQVRGYLKRLSLCSSLMTAVWLIPSRRRRGWSVYPANIVIVWSYELDQSQYSILMKHQSQSYQQALLIYSSENIQEVLVSVMLYYLPMWMVGWLIPFSWGRSISVKTYISAL